MTWPELVAVVVVGFVVNLLVHAVRDSPKAVAFLLGFLGRRPRGPGRPRDHRHEAG
jgi:hypothetical protein